MAGGGGVTLGKNTVYGIGITDASECILIYQKYWFSSKSLLKYQRCVPSQNPTNHPKGLILTHQFWWTKMKTDINGLGWGFGVFFYRKTSIPKEWKFVSNGVRLTFSIPLFSEKWWIQSMSLGTLSEMPHWASVISIWPLMLETLRRLLAAWLSRRGGR